MFPKAVPLLALLALAPVACGRAPQAPAESAAADSPDALYVAPPQVRTARLDGRALVLSGTAPQGARVRLAEPSGEAVFAVADAEGRWTLSLPAGAAPRVFGVSAGTGARTVQSQGYLLTAPDGRAALLRAGAGAVRLDPLQRPAIGAFDFDREGGAVVSGVAPANTDLFLRLNRRQTAEGRSDASGRFEISLPSPVTEGAHRLEVRGDGFSATAVVNVTPPDGLEDGPFRGRTVDGALRADWVTPGGGVQSTLLPG